MTMDQPLTPAQHHLMDRMHAGWELGEPVTPRRRGRLALYRDGVGHGGPVEPVARNTVDALVARGLIARKPHDARFLVRAFQCVPQGERQWPTWLTQVLESRA